MVNSRSRKRNINILRDTFSPKWAFHFLFSSAGSDIFVLSSNLLHFSLGPGNLY